MADDRLSRRPPNAARKRNVRSSRTSKTHWTRFGSEKNQKNSFGSRSRGVHFGTARPAHSLRSYDNVSARVDKSGCPRQEGREPLRPARDSDRVGRSHDERSQDRESNDQEHHARGSSTAAARSFKSQSQTQTLQGPLHRRRQKQSRRRIGTAGWHSYGQDADAKAALSASRQGRQDSLAQSVAADRDVPNDRSRPFPAWTLNHAHSYRPSPKDQRVRLFYVRCSMHTAEHQLGGVQFRTSRHPRSQEASIALARYSCLDPRGERRRKWQNNAEDLRASALSFSKPAREQVLGFTGTKKSFTPKNIWPTPCSTSGAAWSN